MAAFLFKALLAAQLAQAQVPSPESLAVLSSRVAHDSGDAAAWLALGRAQLRAADAYHTHAGPPDTAWARSTMLSAEMAFGRAAALRPGLGLGDSASTFRVMAREDLAILSWELGDTTAVDSVWQEIPTGSRLPPVLEELAENLLRACPPHAVLLTDNDVVSAAAEYLRFNHDIRPDLLTVPLNRYRTDSVFSIRVAKDAGLKKPPKRAESAESMILTLGALRPVCAGVDFGAPPGGHGRIGWQTRPFVWVAGKSSGAGPQVPAADFVFAALKFAIDANDPWARFALDLYRHAARLSPDLCRPMASYGIPRARTGCRS
ncbi:MAG TPA: hypothetical protein VEV39_03735 [Gemmatimonadales bacterium]|nr:hypothetical protein [Gemmatimonadales bacterium]